jgi:hypothetical protein
MSITQRKIAAAACGSLLLQFGAPSFAQQGQPQPPQAPADAQSQGKTSGSSIRVTSELVLANVVVRDKKGNLIRDLKKQDFALYEDTRSRTFRHLILKMSTRSSRRARPKKLSRAKLRRLRPQRREC